MSRWRNRIVGEAMADPAELLDHPANFRRHPDGQRTALDGSLAELGWVQRVVVNHVTGRILDGHLRAELARAAGEPVPVLHVELTEEEERLALASLDPIAALAETDQAALEALLAELEVEHEGLRGFLDGLAGTEPAPTEGLTDPDEAPEPPAEPVTQPGELVMLGEHRLYCGDATTPEAYRLVLGDQPADMVWTDPPYNVAYEGKTAERLTIANDAQAPEAFRDFLLRFFQSALAYTRPGGAIYVAHADTEGLAFRGAMLEAGWKLAQVLVWAKDAFVLGRQDYHWRHEPILYGWHPGGPHTWRGGRTQDTVLEIERPKRNAEHPTMKPVALVARALENSSEPGERVLDPFGGSGSTLIACQQTGRIAHLIELDPRYCDVAVTRWEAFTGQRAQRLPRGNRRGRRATVKRSKAA